MEKSSYREILRLLPFTKDDSDDQIKTDEMGGVRSMHREDGNSCRLLMRETEGTLRFGSVRCIWDDCTS